MTIVVPFKERTVPSSYVASRRSLKEQQGFLYPSKQPRENTVGRGGGLNEEGVRASFCGVSVS